MSKKILIVDDDPDLQCLLKKRLENCGFDCVNAFSVESALAQIKETKPDLVILDLGFQNADGTAFLKNAAQWLPKGESAPPIIVLSCYNDDDIMDYVMDLGATSFMTKPYDPAALVSMIDRCI